MLRLTARRPARFGHRQGVLTFHSSSALSHGHSHVQPGRTASEGTTLSRDSIAPRTRDASRYLPTLLYFSTVPFMVFGVGELGFDNVVAVLSLIAAASLWTLGEVIERIGGKP